MKSTYGIIGIGKFGFVVASELLNAGENVIIADIDENALKDLQDKVSCAYIMDATNITALREAGFQNIDTVLISIGDSVEKSVLTLMALKEIGVKTIIAKANSTIHGQILSKLGVSKIVYPEKESAVRLSRELVEDADFEVIDLSANTVKAVKIFVDESWVGHSLRQIAQNMHLVAHKSGTNDWVLFPELETTLVNMGDRVILVGTDKDLAGFKK